MVGPHGPHGPHGQRNVREVQIFGDSLNTIKWANGSHHCRNFLLLPLLSEIIRLKSIFSNLTLSHIYKERNAEADSLSKKGIEQVLDQWSVEEVAEGRTRRLPPPVFD